MEVRKFLEKNKETIQLVYGIILIILIPLLILANTLFILNKYNTTIDTALQKEALSIGRVAYTMLKPQLNDPAALQSSIVELKKNNIELENIEILKPDGENFQVLASTNPKKIGQTQKFPYYNLAWLQKNNEGLATDSLLFAMDENNELLNEDSENDRFWLVTMPVENVNNEKTALLSLKISSKIIDDLTIQNRNSSIYLMIVTVLLVILFLAAGARFWDYAILYRKAKEIDQMKDEFISMASHELRTPVTAIRGFTSMILDGSTGQINGPTRKDLEIIQKSADRLETLVEDLLNVSRIEQGRIDINLAPTDINPIIIDTVKELENQAQKKGLILEYKNNLEKISQINIDSAKFKQILINLIGNAIKYTEKGKIEVIVEENGKDLEIKIKDTGIGMSAEERQRLFEKFYRVKNSQTNKIQGTGLGLWITKQLVELMVGKITVDSIKGTGTLVALRFPKAK